MYLKNLYYDNSWLVVSFMYLYYLDISYDVELLYFRAYYTIKKNYTFEIYYRFLRVIVKLNIFNRSLCLNLKKKNQSEFQHQFNISKRILSIHFKSPKSKCNIQPKFIIVMWYWKYQNFGRMKINECVINIIERCKQIFRYSQCDGVYVVPFDWKSD